MEQKGIKDLTAALNAYRDHHCGKQFKAEDMFKILADAGLPKSTSFRAIAIKYGIVIKISGGRYAMYTFPPEPIYYAKVENAINELSKVNHKYYARYRDKTSVVEEVSLITVEDEEQKAINLLKSLGYKIYKPTTTFNEI